MHDKNRGIFSSKIGYVMAAAGSAVGLGNIWRFPYLAAKYGGGTFLLVYLILTVTFGFTMLVAETAIGRKTGKSPFAAFRQLDSRFTFIGLLGTLVPIIIFPYYCVIGGWVVKYLWAFLFEGSTAAAADGYFTGFVGNVGEPILWLMVFMAIVFLTVLLGVEKGVEKVSKIMMPILVVLTILISVYSISRPGAMEGVKYYLLPDFSKLTFMTVVAALGQMFFSLSIAMGILITFGSYMPKEVDMEKSIKQVELFDTGIAFLAGLMIVPSVFVFYNGDQSHLNAGPSLMFITLPKVFDSMGMGRLVGVVFFVLVLFAALTSAIALMETVVSSFMDRFSWTRKKASLIVGAGSLLLALPSSLGFGLWKDFMPLGMSILDFFDFMSNSVLMPITALVTCLFVSRVVGVSAIVQEVEISSAFKRKKMFVVFVKYVAPICLIAILISSVLNTFGIISI